MGWPPDQNRTSQNGKSKRDKRDKRRSSSSGRQQPQYEQLRGGTGSRVAPSPAIPFNWRDGGPEFGNDDMLRPFSCNIDDIGSIFDDGMTADSTIDLEEDRELMNWSSESTVGINNKGRKQMAVVSVIDKPPRRPPLRPLIPRFIENADDDGEAFFFRQAPELRKLRDLESVFISNDPKFKGGSSRCRWCQQAISWLAIAIAVVLVVHACFALGIFLSDRNSDSVPLSVPLSTRNPTTTNIFDIQWEPTYAPFINSSTSSPSHPVPVPSAPAPTAAAAAGAAAEDKSQPLAPSPSIVVNIPVSPDATIAPTLSERFDTIQRRIHRAIPGEAVLDSNSLQYKVVEWLVDEDPMQLPLLETPLSVLLERFVLALLYRTTYGYDWFYSNQFMTNTSVCNWNAGVENSGVYCDIFGSVERIIMCK
jgi:hypothetical protein